MRFEISTKGFVILLILLLKNIATTMFWGKQPVEDGKLILGTWQQIVFVDFDNRPREREILVKVFGNKK
jgi:hypothetical protein